MKRLYLSILFSIFTLLIFVTPSFASSGGTFDVTVDNSNITTAPSPSQSITITINNPTATFTAQYLYILDYTTGSNFLVAPGTCVISNGQQCTFSNFTNNDLGGLLGYTSNPISQGDVLGFALWDSTNDILTSNQQSIPFSTVLTSSSPTPTPTATPTPNPTHSLTGTVYVDSNQNSALDPGEVGYQGATVFLNTGQSTSTDSNGNYSFSNLPAGSYTINISLLNAGFTATTNYPVTVALSADTTENIGIVPVPSYNGLFDVTVNNSNVATAPSPSQSITITINNPTATFTAHYLYILDYSTGSSWLVGTGTCAIANGQQCTFSNFTKNDIGGLFGYTSNPISQGDVLGFALWDDIKGTVDAKDILASNQQSIPFSTVLTSSQSTVSAITISPNPVQINTPITATATFTDPNGGSSDTATWDWGDGSATQSATVTETNGSGSINDNHPYTAAGIYTVTLIVTDPYGASTTQTFQYVSVYAPTNQGIFSAGQHFSSPTGAYTLNPSLTGNVQFGLAYKYSGGMPVGDRQFTMTFNAGNLTFNATSVSSLVISNGFATLEGTGTINGSGNYNFLVTGTDGGGVRIQITDPSNNNAVIYDTQPGDPATAIPITTVTGNVIAH